MPVEQCDRDATSIYEDAIGAIDDKRLLDMLFAAHRIAAEQRGYERCQAKVVVWLADTSFGDDDIDHASIRFANAIERGEFKPSGEG